MDEMQGMQEMQEMDEMQEKQEMQDLTHAFLAALAAPAPWDLKRIGANLIAVGTRLGLQFYWDGGVGSYWMEFWDNATDRHGAVWVNAPIAFVSPAVDDEMVQALKRYGATLVSVPKWDEIAYRIDPQAVRDAGTTPWAKDFWHATDDVVSRAAFSIADLIWATE
jgi:hypothetical protein